MARELAIVVTLTLCWAAIASGREWTTRNGQDLGEGKLLDAGDDFALIRFDGRGALRVPLAQLSLEDAMFVREALALTAPLSDGAAALPAAMPEALPAEAATASPDAPTAEDAASDGFPLTRPGSTVWQVHPDPPAYQWPDEDAAHAAETPLRAARDVETVVLPAQPSPFLAVCASSNAAVWDLWNLVTGQRGGVVRGGEVHSRLQAVSADGRYFATAESHGDRKVQIWEFESGKLLREAILGNRGSADRLFWCADGRLFVVADSQGNGAEVIDALSGKVTPLASPSSRDRSYDLWVSTPGGHYVANVAPSNDRIEFYDVRNGALAGDVLLPADDVDRGDLRQLAFSPDGAEMLAWAVDRNRRMIGRVLRWSLATGELIDSTEYALSSAEAGEIPLGNAGRMHVAFGDVDGGRLVDGARLLDSEAKRPIWSYLSGAGARRRPIMRVLNANYILTSGFSSADFDVRVEPLPKEEIAKSRAIVAAGGTTEDLSLPAIVAADYGDAPRSSPFPASDRPYAPSAAPDLPAEMADKLQFGVTVKEPPVGNIVHIAFARAAPQRAVSLVHLSDNDVASLPAEAPERRLPFRFDVLDLAAGKRTAHWNVGNVRELLGASPSGRRVLVRSTDDDRFDVWDVDEGKHVAGFRLATAERAAYRSTTWGALIDDNHALLLFHNGELALWSVEPCRLIYSRAAPTHASPVLSADGKYFALRDGANVMVVEASTGATVATLPLGAINQDPASPALSFSPDGQRLAALTVHADGSARLAVWHIADQRVAADLQLMTPAGSVSWSGDDVLLTSVPHASLTGPDAQAPPGPYAPSPSTYYQQQMMLRQGAWGAVRIDLDRSEAAWSYLLEGCRRLDGGPGRRTWFLQRSQTGSAQLVSLGERSADEQEALASIPEPQRAEFPGDSITVAADVGPLPQFVGRNEQRREDFDRALRQHFEALLRDQIFIGPADAKLTFKVVLQEHRGEDLPQVYPPRGDIRRGVGVLARLSIVNGGQALWTVEQWLASGYLQSGIPPQPHQATSYLAAWEKAMEWALAQSPPRNLQSAQSLRGFGQSRLTPDGLVVIRRWSRSGDGGAGPEANQAGELP